jgi:hypothetical protein
MLGDNYLLELSINDEERELKFDFRFLRNLNSLLRESNSNCSPIDYIDNFIKAEDKEKYYIDILYCMLNGEISLEDLQEIIEKVKENLFPVLFMLIVTEWRVEDIFENEENDSEEEAEKESNENEFLRFWDSNYYNAIYQLNMTEEEFLNSSPREIGTLNKLNAEYYKNIILQRDMVIQNTRKKANEYGEKEEIIEGTRLKDMF